MFFATYQQTGTCQSSSMSLAELSHPKCPELTQTNQAENVEDIIKLLTGNTLISDHGISLSIKDSLLWASIKGFPDSDHEIALGLKFKQISPPKQISLITDLKRLIALTHKDELDHQPFSSLMVQGLLAHRAIDELKLSKISLKETDLTTPIPVRRITIDSVDFNNCEVDLLCRNLILKYVVFSGHSLIRINCQKGRWTNVFVNKESMMIGDFGDTVIDRTTEIQADSDDFNFHNQVPSQSKPAEKSYACSNILNESITPGYRSSI